MVVVGGVVVVHVGDTEGGVYFVAEKIHVSGEVLDAVVFVGACVF